MGFSKTVIEQALSEKENMRKAAEGKAAAAKKAVYSAHPELNSLDMKISGSGAKIAITAMSGGDIGALKSEIDELTSLRRKIIGAAADSFEPDYNCKNCNDSGFCGGRLCSCVTAICSRIVCESMSEEMPLGDSRFDNFDLTYYSDKPNENGVVPRKRMSEISDFCRDYAENFSMKSGNLLFTGNTGLGKTHLTLAIAGEVISRGHGVIYGPSSRLLSKVEKEHFGGKGNDYYESLLECDLLIIDDLGTEFVSPFIISVVNDIINTRLLEKRPTVISTNLTLKEIEDKYTPRVTSRIIGSYVIKQFAGQDIRQLKQIRSRRK